MNDVGEQAVQTEQLANTMLQQVYALLARHNIIPNAVQEQMQFGNLPDEEAWLLSVHFEVAKDNL